MDPSVKVRGVITAVAGRGSVIREGPGRGVADAGSLLGPAWPTYWIRVADVSSGIRIRRSYP
jgi:hypothetical protein